MKKLILFLLLIIGQVAFAQKYSIRGKVAEKQGDVLPFASVLLLQPKDSSVISHTTTNTYGAFILNDIKKGTYIFKVTFIGFAPYFKNITTPSTTDTLHLGMIELRPKAIELEELTVTEPEDPVVVKKDTVEYNADSFGTRPNANVEQLLEKLPGLNVRNDGSIHVQGESVTRIFVDGKEFFGGDLQMATKNLPADAINKVQVIDGKSEQAKFSGIDDGQREKVINLTLKEDKRNMGFGKATAGAGTSNRYMAEANYNVFDESNQVSVMGMSNNVNKQNISSDGLSGSGAATEIGASMGENGLVNTHMGGASMYNQLTEKTSINGTYRLTYTKANIKSNLTRQNFLPEGTALYYENSVQQNSNRGHAANVGLEHKDSVNTLRANIVFGLTDAQMAASSGRQSYSVAGALVNEGERTSVARNKNLNLNASLFYGRRFQKKGRSFTITNQFSTYQVDATGRSESFTNFSEGTEEDVRQRNEQENKNLNFSTRLAYTEPLGNKQYLQANYNMSNRSSISNREVFDIVDETHLFNAEQSSQLSSGYLYQQVGLTYRLNQDKYNLGIGFNLQKSQLSRKLQETGETIKQGFRNVLPNLNFDVRLNDATQLSFDYTTSVREPTINQLQPVVSRYDPLHLYVGNPNLRPEYTHQGKLNFNTFAAASGIFLSSSVNFNYTVNPITEAVTINERQVRTTQYVNVKGNRTFAAFLNVGVPVEKLNSQFNLSPYLSQEQSTNLLNGVAGTINQRSLGGNLSYTYSYEEYVDVNLSTDINVTNSAYELNENQNQVFVTSAYMADATLHFLKKFNFIAEMNYTRFRNTQTNFNQAIPIFNFSLSRFLLKDNRGELKLSALNVLNRNVGATQFATQNYIEQSTQNALGNYYMLSFTYHLNVNYGSSD